MHERSHHHPFAERLWTLTNGSPAKATPSELRQSRVVGQDATRRCDQACNRRSSTDSAWAGIDADHVAGAARGLLDRATVAPA
jgi:hypothetical protein